MAFGIDEDKIRLINIILFIINLDDNKEVDMHTIFKVMYRAEKIHILRYGVKMAPDKYVALDYGPVPSIAYDILKKARSNFSNYFEVEESNTKAKIEPDMDEITEAEIECLTEAFNIIRPLNFSERTTDSHDVAYNSVGRNEIIPITKIAKAGGANDELIKYIEICEENEKAPIWCD